MRGNLLCTTEGSPLIGEKDRRGGDEGSRTKRREMPLNGWRPLDGRELLERMGGAATAVLLLRVCCFAFGLGAMDTWLLFFLIAETKIVRHCRCCLMLGRTLEMREAKAGGRSAEVSSVGVRSESCWIDRSKEWIHGMVKAWSSCRIGHRRWEVSARTSLRIAMNRRIESLQKRHRAGIKSTVTPYPLKCWIELLFHLRIVGCGEWSRMETRHCSRGWIMARHTGHLKYSRCFRSLMAVLLVVLAFPFSVHGMILLLPTVLHFVSLTTIGKRC